MASVAPDGRPMVARGEARRRRASRTDPDEFGAYHTFTEPSALCNVLEPVYERSFISDSYACRTGKASGSVSESNRLGALFTPPTGFEDLKPDAASPVTASTSATDTERLASCLAFLTRISPDLALVVERWNQLPDALRAGILAMVKASF